MPDTVSRAPYTNAMNLFNWIMLVLAVVFVVVAFVRYRNQPVADERSPAQKERDYRIGVAMGALGYDVKYAAVVRYALERFEEEKGRQATEKELYTLIGTAMGVAQSQQVE